MENLEFINDINGTSEDIKNRILNAERMINIFGEKFELDMPIFRNSVCL